MKEIDLVSLRLFTTVCESSSFVHAAEVHNTVPSAVSKRMSLLEVEMGVVLLERTRRGARPTSAGQALWQHARSLLLQADQARRDMQAFGCGVKGKVRLIATVSAIAERLPSDLAAFLGRPEHSAIQVEIEECVSRDLARALHAGAANLGVSWDAADLGGLSTRPYRTDRLAVVTHRDHPMALRQACCFAETLEYEHVGLPAPTAGFDLLARAASAAGRPIHYRALLSSFEAVMRFVAANLGISVVPIEIANAYAGALKLVLVPLEDTWASRRFVLSFVDDATITPAGKLLLEFLVDRSAEINGSQSGN